MSIMSIRKQMYKHNRAKRKAWTTEEAEAFLHFYKARKSEFNSARKKRKAYNNVLNDMIAAGITGPKTTVSHLEVKMTTLQRTYRLLRNEPRTDTVPTPCMLKMHEIFGEEPKISDNSLNIGLCTVKEDPVPDDYGDTKILENWDSFSADEQIKMDPDEICKDESSYLYVKSEENSEYTTETAVTPATLSSSTAHDPQLYPDTPALLLNSQSQNKKPKMNRARYLEEKLKIKIQAENKKSERWEQFKAIEEKKIELLKKLFESLKK